MPRTYWPDADKATLRIFLSSGKRTLREAADALGKSYDSTHRVATRMGLTWRDERRPWTPEEDAAIRAAYKPRPGWKKERDQLAVRFGRTSGAIKHRAQALEVAVKSGKSRPWTKADDEELAELLETHSRHAVAKKLGRSLNAINIRCQKLRLYAAYRDGWYTADDVAFIVGVNPSWVQRRIERGMLRDERDGQAHRITVRALKEFIKAYPGELQGRPVDMVSVVQVLVGDA